MKIPKYLQPFLFTLLGVLPAVILFIAFLFISSGADLTTSQGDYILGKLSVNFIELGILVDIMRFCFHKIKSKN